MILNIEHTWKKALQPVFEQEYFDELLQFIENEYSQEIVFPDKKDVFAAFNLCPMDKIKVVILGQDPYHGEGQAHGLSFSVKPGVAFPPSLRNIFKEQQTDLGIEVPASGDLTRWAEQGVFLLNATLTVRKGQAGSHQKKGWEKFTDEVIRTISEVQDFVVFLLWGSYAQKKSALIDTTKHVILTAPHPSPLSSYRGFFGCSHFSKANKLLEQNGKKPIHW